MNSRYDRFLQEESEEWFEEYDSETTDGYLRDLTGEPLDEDDENEIFRMSGIY